MTKTSWIVEGLHGWAVELLIAGLYVTLRSADQDNATICRELIGQLKQQHHDILRPTLHRLRTNQWLREDSRYQPVASVKLVLEELPEEFLSQLEESIGRILPEFIPHPEQTSRWWSDIFIACAQHEDQNQVIVSPDHIFEKASDISNEDQEFVSAHPIYHCPACGHPFLRSETSSQKTSRDPAGLFTSTVTTKRLHCACGAQTVYSN